MTEYAADDFMLNAFQIKLDEAWVRALKEYDNFDHWGALADMASVKEALAKRSDKQ